MSPFLWGVASAVVVLPIVAFSAGWVVTSGYAEEKAEQRATAAVVERLADICVAQFPDGAEGKRQLAGLKAANYSDKDDFVASNGWATMPGTQEPNSAVAEVCADMLLERT